MISYDYIIFRPVSIILYLHYSLNLLVYTMMKVLANIIEMSYEFSYFSMVGNDIKAIILVDGNFGDFYQIITISFFFFSYKLSIFHEFLAIFLINHQYFGNSIAPCQCPCLKFKEKGACTLAQT